jgi:Ca-activated chloride channel homolog
VRRRLIAAMATAAAAALPVPATAGAQAIAGNARPVVGGGSFNTAQTLTPGTYRDTLLPREFLYYAVEAKPGQRIRVRVEADTDDDTFEHTNSVIEIVTFGPLRNVLGGDPDTDDSITAPGDVAEVTTLPAGQDEVADGGTPQPGPGRYYVAFFSDWTKAVAPLQAEVPMRFTVSVLDPSGAAATATPSPMPTRTPAETPAPGAAARTDDGGDGSGTNAVVLAGSAVGGVLVGTLLAVVAGLRRRRRHPAA